MRRAYACDCDGESHTLPRIVRSPGMAAIAARVRDEIEAFAASPASGCPWRAWADPVVTMGQRIVTAIESGADVSSWPACAVRAAEAISATRSAVEAHDREADRREREERAHEHRTRR